MAATMVAATTTDGRLVLTAVIGAAVAILSLALNALSAVRDRPRLDMKLAAVAVGLGRERWIEATLINVGRQAVGIEGVWAHIEDDQYRLLSQKFNGDSGVENDKSPYVLPARELRVLRAPVAHVRDGIDSSQDLHVKANYFKAPLIPFPGRRSKQVGVKRKLNMSKFDEADASARPKD